MSERPPRRRLPWLAAAMILTVCLGVPTYLTYSFFADQQTVKELPGPASAYLDALIAGDRAKGYELLCQRRRERVSFENWRAERGMEPHLVGYRLLQGHVYRDTENGVGYGIDVELHYSDGHREQITLPMTEEKAGWRICTDHAY
ncbi:hypothetical protein QEZ54_09020 [Catellatospora sp. KI3]|uniref:hypothetical protein n=1 Tax=Catellatospora sp. KI3 TaxID=3041620 RepID=UPI0024828A3D|nr:hypothetical protein [Catellatospora sp. KI3]MDI1461104.1 hypothetical protein [Catellatospora sp. KI3]